MHGKGIPPGVHPIAVKKTLIIGQHGIRMHHMIVIVSGHYIQISHVAVGCGICICIINQDAILHKCACDGAGTGTSKIHIRTGTGFYFLSQHIQIFIGDALDVIIPDLYFNALGIAVPDCTFLPEIKSGCGRQHNQNHGQQNADGSKAGTISFHTVCHGGYGYKMVGLVVVVFIGLQQLAECHGTGNKKQIRSEDNHNYCHKE